MSVELMTKEVFLDRWGGCGSNAILASNDLDILIDNCIAERLSKCHCGHKYRDIHEMHAHYKTCSMPSI